MSTFKRFKDSITGLFVSPAQAARNANTTARVDVSGLSAGKRRILKGALEDEKLASSPYMANKVLRDAIEKVLSTSR